MQTRLPVFRSPLSGCSVIARSPAAAARVAGFVVARFSVPRERSERIKPSKRRGAPAAPSPGRPEGRHYKRRARRAGVTLTEVLMSLLVMGIGVTSVATLFPLAVLRGARATQLTAGTVLKENAEETVRFSRSPSLESPLPAAIGGVPLGGGVGVFPHGTSPGVDGGAMLLDPDANGSLSLCGPAAKLKANPSNSMFWGGYLSNGGTPRKYVVDPLGAAVLAADGNAGTSVFQYGALNKGVLVDQYNNPLTTAPGFEPTLRFAWPFPHEMLAAAEGGNAALRQQMIETAYAIVGRAGDYGTDVDTVATITRREGTPDYLEVEFDARDVEAGSLEEFFPQAGTGAAAPGADGARAIVFSPDQRSSAAIPLSRLREQTTIDVAPDGGRTVLLALPRSGFLSSTGMTSSGATGQLRVRIERPDRRYSWMLTSRRTGSIGQEAQVAVFFNRALAPEDESTWRCEKTDGENKGSYVLFWDSAAAQRNPQVGGGTFLLEMRELRWLQAGRVLEEDGDPTAGRRPGPRHSGPYGALGATLGEPHYLEFLLSAETPRINEAGASGPLFATFPRGVVDVYTLDP